MRSVRRGTGALFAALVVLVAGTVGAVPAGSTATVEARPTVPRTPLSVVPSTGLVDTQTVTITAPPGYGTNDENFVEYVLCPAGATDYEGCALLDYPGMGQATIDVALPARILAADATRTVTVTDCRATACVVRAVGFDAIGPTVVAEAPVTFDPAAPLRPAPELAATPTTGLVDAQVIEVTAASAASPTATGGPGTVVVQCTAPIHSTDDLQRILTDCDLSTSVEYPPYLAGTVEFWVRAYVETADGPVDCRAPWATCALVAVDAVGQVADLAIGFDPDGPVEPALLQRPGTWSDELGPMIFDVVGFTPGDPFTVRWCNDAGACLPGTLASGTLDAHGVGSFTLEVTFPDVDDTDGVCADACSLTVIDAHGLSATGPYGIGIGPPEPPPGPFSSAQNPVTVTPHKGLGDGATVTVTASGFQPGASVAVVECTGSVFTDGARACDVDTSTVMAGESVVADAHGRVSTTYTIERFIETVDGSFDCAEGNIDPDAYARGIAVDPSRSAVLGADGYFTCVIAVADLGDYADSGATPIAFDGARFERLPWERDRTGRPGTAPAATAVRARPAFTG